MIFYDFYRYFIDFHRLKILIFINDFVQKWGALNLLFEISSIYFGEKIKEKILNRKI